MNIFPDRYCSRNVSCNGSKSGKMPEERSERGKVLISHATPRNRCSPKSQPTVGH